MHCEEGISRASAVAIAYLMSAGLDVTKNSSESCDCSASDDDEDDAPLKPKVSYREAYDYVLKIRPTAAPNLAFVVALTLWERQNCPGRETANEVEALTGVLDQLSLIDSHRPVWRAKIRTALESSRRVQRMTRVIQWCQAESHIWANRWHARLF